MQQMRSSSNRNSSNYTGQYKKVHKMRQNLYIYTYYISITSPLYIYTFFVTLSFSLENKLN